MATNFPASLDTLTNPTSSDSLSSPSHSAQHANVNDAVEALQAKVGADSSAVTTSLDYKVAQLEAISHGKILQVVSTTKTNTFTTTSTSYVDVTGVSQAITPTSATSKVLIIITGVTGQTSNADLNRFNIVRDSTNIGQSTGGATANETSFIYPLVANVGVPFAISFLDSPATTSATTYKLQMAVSGGTGTIGRHGQNSNSGAITTITVMEVAA